MSDPNFIIPYVKNPAQSAAFYAGLLGRPPVDSSPNFAMFALSSGVMLGLWACGPRTTCCLPLPVWAGPKWPLRWAAGKRWTTVALTGKGWRSQSSSRPPTWTSATPSQRSIPTGTACGFLRPMLVEARWLKIVG